MNDKRRITFEGNWPSNEIFNAFLESCNQVAQQLQTEIQKHLDKEGIDKIFTIKVEVQDDTEQTLLGSITYSHDRQTLLHMAKSDEEE
jgi:hypothetical protein